MMNQFRMIGLALLLVTACVKQLNSEDLDEDGIPDSRDQCMADPEDLDGFEDDDGCPEEGSPVRNVDANDNTTPLPGPDVKTEDIKQRKAKPLEQSNGKATITPFRKTAWGTEFADNHASTSVVFGFGKAWITADGNERLLRREVYQAHFSPNGTIAALVTSKEFLVVDVSTGATLRKFPYAKGDRSTMAQEIRLIGEDEVIYFDGCQLFRVSLLNKKRPVSITDKICGRPITTPNGERWFVWQQDQENVAVYELASSNTPSKTPRLVLGGRGDAPGLSLLKLSPNGRYLCYSRHSDGSEFTCRDLKLETDLMLWKGPTDKRPAFSHNGNLAFGTGTMRTSRTLYHVSMDKRTLRPLGKLGPKEKWLHALGRDSFVASGGQRLVIFDLRENKRLVVPLDSGEWEGLSAIPRQTRSFIVGKERRTTRDLFRIDVR